MTRSGLIADIHGNTHTLRLILDELDRARVDEVICLGDVAVLGPEPQVAIAELRKRGVPTVAGNTDFWLQGRPALAVEGPDPGRSQRLTEWTRSTLSESDLAWIEALPLTINRTTGEFSVCFCHGSPEHPDDIMQNLTPERVGEFGFDLIVGGHTHQATESRIGTTTYINPGSAGLPGVGPGAGIPIHHGANWVEYAILEIESRSFNVNFERIPVDVGEMTEIALNSGMPDPEWWTERWQKLKLDSGERR